LVDGDTIRFTLPPLGIGSHTLSFAPATILDIQGMPLAAHSSTFSIAALAPRVTATSLAPGGIAAPGDVSYGVTFDKPMKASNLSADDFVLKGNQLNANYSATSFSFNADGTVLTLNFANLP